MDLSDKNISLQRAKKHVHKPGYKFPVEKRIEVVTTVLKYGNMKLASELTGVSYQLIRMWKGQPWWAEMVNEIKASRNLQLDTKLSKIVDRSLELMEDRLENGDFVYNNKTGDLMRKPVSLKELNTVTKDMMNHQIQMQKLEQNAEVITQQDSIQDRLNKLALEFAKFNKTNTGPVQDAVIIGESDAFHDQWEARLQEGSSEVYEQAGSEEEEGDAECGETGDDEEGFSEEGRWEGR